MKYIKQELRLLRKQIEHLASQSTEGDCKYATRGQDRTPLTPSIHFPEDVLKFCNEHFKELIERGLQEEFHVITLNGAHQVIRTHLVTIGIANASQVHPREVFRPAVIDSAVSVILVHNHPSGSSLPSQADKTTTKRMAKAGDVLGISVLDHVILASGGSYSFKEQSPTYLVS